MEATQTELTRFTAEIVSAYVTNNPVRSEDLPELISATFAALTNVGTPSPAPIEKKLPAVPIKKSVTPDYLISLEDGRMYKALKRHLSGLGMTPADYRAKWGLPSDYPMVAPNYAKRRSDLAKASGLGRKDGASEAARSQAESNTATAKAKRARAKKPEAATEA